MSMIVIIPASSAKSNHSGRLQKSKGEDFLDNQIPIVIS